MSISADVNLKAPGGLAPPEVFETPPPAARSLRTQARGAGRSGAHFVRGSYGLVNRAVQAADILACILAPLLLRTAWIVSADPLSWLQAFMIGVLVAIGFSTSLRILGGYRFERYQKAQWSAADVVCGWLAAVGVVALVLWTFDPVLLGAKRWMTSWTVLLLTILLAERSLLFAVLPRVVRAGVLRRRVAVIGANAVGQELRRRVLSAQETGGYALVGLFDEVPRPEAGPGPETGEVAGDVEDLCALALDSQIDLIVIALPWTQADSIFALCEQVQWISADVVAPLDRSAVLAHSALSGDVAGAPVLQLAHHPFRGTEGMVKVAEDYVIASVALVLLAPVMIAAALAVKLSGPGPALFRQTRIGFNGRRFHIYKFRTMTVDPADDGSLGTHKDNPRITPVGRFLRRTSLDELPQLLNVLRGEMSVVGPRPHVPNMFIAEKSYAETVRAYAARHRIKPGITGWAQINGMRGGIDSVEKARRGVELDLHYIKSWSLRLDLTIMLRTVFTHMAGPSVF